MNDGKNKRIAALSHAAQEKKRFASEATDKAIRKLASSNQPITIANVARLAGVSTSYIYKYPELKEREDYRGSGIGTAFFQWLEKTWGTSSVALSLQTTPSNERTLAFYERMGFRASPNHHLMKLLSPEVTKI